VDRVLQLVSDYAISWDYERLSQEVVHQVKRRLIDSIGCAIGGYLAKPSEIARAHALEVRANPGATVLGTRHRSAPELAAFANAVMVRYLDFNDTGCLDMSAHPSVNIPAVLAAAEYADASGQTAISGIVLAYEVQGRFADVCSSLLSRGWDIAANYAVLASAAGAGKVLGLSRENMANALALAVNSGISLGQSRVGSLSMWKGCSEANASRNGLFAALLARRGMTGPEEAFEGSKGYFKIVIGTAELPSFGVDGQIFKVQETAFKYYPSDYEAQCAANPAVELHYALGAQVEEIEMVIVDTYDFAMEISADTRDKWHPKTRETADHSIPYVVAVALTKGSVWLDDFTPERIRDPRLLALMQKIEVRRNEEYTRAFPESNCCRIEVITRSGERHVREIRYAKGHPKNPMTDQEIEAKFRRLTEPVMKPAQINAILNRLWHLEEVYDLREMLTLFELQSGG
jgi:2-methylcitrate dehydratase